MQMEFLLLYHFGKLGQKHLGSKGLRKEREWVVFNNIHVTIKHEEERFIQLPNKGKWVWKYELLLGSSTNFEMFGNRMKYSSEGVI